MIKLRTRMIDHYSRRLAPYQSLSIRSYRYTYDSLKPQEWLAQYDLTEQKPQKILKIEIRGVHSTRFLTFEIVNDRWDSVIKAFIHAVANQDTDNFFYMMFRNSYFASRVNLLTSTDNLVVADSILQ